MNTYQNSTKTTAEYRLQTQWSTEMFFQMSKCVFQWSCNMCYCFLILAIFLKKKNHFETHSRLLICVYTIFYYSLFHYALFDDDFYYYSLYQVNFKCIRINSKMNGSFHSELITWLIFQWFCQSKFEWSSNNKLE